MSVLDSENESSHKSNFAIASRIVDMAVSEKACQEARHILANNYSNDNLQKIELFLSLVPKRADF